MLRQHCRSEQHRRVLACLLECRTKGSAPNLLNIASTTSNKVTITKAVVIKMNCTDD